MEDDRPIGPALGPIPSTAIVAWLKEVEGERDPAAIARIVRLVRAIDNEFLAAQVRKDKPASGR